MQMVSMKMPKSEDKAEGEAPDEGNDGYPYGLSINLDEDTMAKLGVDGLKVGQKVMITASAVVKSTSEYSQQDGTEKNAGLQITDMALAAQSDVEGRPGRMYKSMGEGLL